MFIITTKQLPLPARPLLVRRLHCTPTIINHQMQEHNNSFSVQSQKFAKFAKLRRQIMLSSHAVDRPRRLKMSPVVAINHLT